MLNTATTKIQFPERKRRRPDGPPEPRRPEPPVHFHQGPAGEPAPCFDEACMRPRMTV
jgi:hypothetical protein